MIVLVNNYHGVRSPRWKRLQRVLSSMAPVHVVSSPGDLLSLTSSSVVKVKAIVLSGGPLYLSQPVVFKEAASINALVMSWFPDVPVLGICFGCQYLQALHGATLTHHATKPTKGLRTVRVDRSHPLLSGLSGDTVKASFAFHDTIHDVNKDMWQPLAWLKDYECAWAHRQRPWYAVMFHPEDVPEQHVVMRNLLKI